MAHTTHILRGLAHLGSAVIVLALAWTLLDVSVLQAHNATATADAVLSADGRTLAAPDRWHGLIILGVCVFVGASLLGLALLWVLRRTRRRIVASPRGIRIEDPQTGRHVTLDGSRQWLEALLNAPPKQ